jgi:hypothetical protein
MTRIRLFWRDAENMTTVGFIGSGQIGSAIARLAIAAGHQVMLSNSRGPETLADTAAELGPAASAATSGEAAAAGDIVVVTVPVKAVRGYVTVCDAKVPFADPLYERQEPALTRQIRHVACWPPGKRDWALPKAFFLLSGPELGPGSGTYAPPPARARPNSNTCAASQAIPVAVLCCCTCPKGWAPDFELRF